MSVLRFKTVEVHRLPGIPRGSGFTLDDLSTDINLIHGPNGAGKSLTGRTLLELLWPGTDSLDKPTVTGSWTLDGDTWRVEIESGHAIHRCNGVEAERPRLLPADSRLQHWLGLRELLATDGPDADATGAFAERIARELLGGFNLESVSTQLELTDRPTRPRKVRDAFRAAQQRLKNARDAEQALHARSEHLESLIEACEDARQADEERRRLDEALKHREAAEDVARLQGKLDAFPPAIEKLRGDEQERLEDSRRRLRQAEDELEDAERQLADAEQRKTDAGLAGEGVAQEVLHAAGADLEIIRGAEQGARATEAEREKAMRTQSSRAELLASTANPETLASLGVTPGEDMARYARDLLAHRQHAEQVETRERALADANGRLSAEIDALEAGPADHMRRALDVLSRWLASAGKPDAGAARWSIPLLVAAAVIAALFVVLAVLQHAAWLAGLAFVIAFAWLARPKRSAGASPEDRLTYQREYESLGQPQPSAWTTDAVRQLWFERAEAWAQRVVLDQRRQEFERDREAVAADRHRADETAQSLRQRRVDLEAKLGFQIDDTRADWLGELGAHLGAWQSAKVEADGLSAKLDEQRNEIHKALARFNDRLAPYVDSPAKDASEAAGLLEHLKERDRAYRLALSQIEHAQRERKRAAHAIEDASTQIDRLLTGLALDADREFLLYQWLERLAEYRTLSEQLRDARVRKIACVENVGEGHPALEHDRARIESDRDAAQRQASRLSELEQKIGAIRQEIERAKAGHQIEDAQRELDEATDALASTLRDAERKAAGHAVLEWLRDEATEKTQPPVLQRASEVFGRITRGRYELRVDDSGRTPALAAWDTLHETRKSLDELSAGERVQLLVAVRLGFLDHEESGVRLPVLLDETLGTTDDDRARVMIDTVAEICRTGRQVFYFTAQPDEVGKWIARLRDTPDIELKEIDLARVRRLAEASSTPLVIARPDEEPVPKPAGMSHEAYGNALCVPGLDPARPAGLVHLWHVVDDPETLHALLQKRIATVGQFESRVVKRLVRVDGLAEEDTDRIAVRARAIRAAFEAWRIGRAAPVDRAVLEEADAVTDNFIDRVWEVAAGVGGDGRQLVHALNEGRVPRWRTANTERLREYLEEHGYLVRDEPLTPDEICQRVLEESARTSDGPDLDPVWIERVVRGLP